MSLASCLWLQVGVDRKLSTCAAICRLRRVAPGPLRLALPDPSIDQRSYKQSDDGKALFLTMMKALEQGMSRDEKDFSGNVYVKWKDSEFERQVRSESLCPRGDANSCAQQTSATVARRRELSSSNREVDKHPGSAHSLLSHVEISGDFDFKDHNHGNDFLACEIDSRIVARAYLERKLKKQLT